MSYRIVFRPTAKADLQNLTEFSIERWGKARTADYLDVVHSALARLAENPKVGSDRGLIAPGLRKLRAGSHAIYFFFDGETV